MNKITNTINIMETKTTKISTKTKETFDQVVSSVEQAFHVENIFQRSNSPRYTICRAVASYILRERKGLRVSEICALAGIKNHSRIIYYIDVYRRESFHNKAFQKIVRSLNV